MKENNQLTVKPGKERLVNIIDQIRRGEIKIPRFQRNLVWKDGQMKELFDSINHGYPIGSVLFWQPNQEFDCYKSFGPYEIISQQSNEKILYVLDGCQRLTTLFGTLANPKKFIGLEQETIDKRFIIYYDLKEKEFTNRKITSNNPRYVPLYKIFDTYEYLGVLKIIQDNVTKTEEQNLYIENLKTISTVFIDYEIPYTTINGGNIDDAVEIFTRVNTMGTDVNKDGMIAALTYNKDSNFMLTNIIDDFLIEMSVYNFDSIKRETILNCIACALDENKIYFDVNIQDKARRDKKNFEFTSRNSLIHIRKAIEFLYYELKVIDSRLLPYPNQLIFISEFFRINDTNIDITLKEKLKRWFWITSYSNYFTIYKLSEQRKSYQIFRDFANGDHENGIFLSSDNENEKFPVQEFPNELNLSSVRAKTLQLFILNSIDVEGIHKKEKITEHFIYNNQGRKVGNIILDFSSQYVNHLFRTDLLDFVNNKGYFINNEIKLLNICDSENELIEQREQLIKEAEISFLENLTYLKNNL